MQIKKNIFNQYTGKDPLFVIGTGRSGTTIIARCLAENPSLLFIDEPNFLFDPIYQTILGRYSKEEFLFRLKISNDGSGKEPMKFFRRLDEHYQAQIDRQSRQNIKDQTQVLCANLFHDLTSCDSRFTNNSVRQLIWKLTALTCSFLGGQQWLIKQPNLSLILNWLVDVFPKSYFIHVIRRPEDVLCSRLEGGFQSSFEDAFEVWFSRLKGIADFSLLFPNRIKHIQFESFIDDPITSINNVFDFTGTNRHYDVELSIKHIDRDKAHIGRGSNKLSSLEVIQINEASRELNNLLGFDLVGN